VEVDADVEKRGKVGARTGREKERKGRKTENEKEGKQKGVDGLPQPLLADTH